MATVNVTTSQNFTAVTYAVRDTINVNDGVTLTVNSAWSTRPFLIQALGTGRIEVSNSSTTTPMVLEFDTSAANSGGFSVQQNGVLQIRGGWITVATSTGTANQVLFSSNSVGGVAIDYPSLIEVETGSGTNVWEIWQAIPEDVSGGSVNTLGWNKADTTTGTVAITTAGVVTGTGTTFTSSHVGTRFKLPSITRDFIISAFTSATSITIQELDGTTYSGGTITAGTSYIARDGSLINKVQVGSGDLGKVLFFNPLTTQVRMGDGTNGTMIPSGARVRIPNIHLNTQLQQTTLAAAITSSASQAITLTAAIGPTTNGAFSTSAGIGSLLLVNGSTVERIYYSTRSGTTVSATSQQRGVYGTTAQASFPIGTTVYWLPSYSQNTANGLINCNPSGTVDCQIFSTGLRWNTVYTNYAALTLNHCGGTSFITSGGSGSFNLDNLSLIGSGFTFPGVIVSPTAANFSGMIGSGSITNVSAFNNAYGAITAQFCVSFSNLPGLSALSNIKARNFNRFGTGTGSTVRVICFSNIACSQPIDGLYVAGGALTPSVVSGIDVKNVYFSSSTNGSPMGSGDILSPLYLTNSLNSIYRGIQNWSGGVAPRAPLVALDAGCQNNIVHNRGYASVDGGGQCAAISNDAGLNSVVTHITVTNPRATNTSSDLSASISTNSGGTHRMLFIDSVTSTATNTGAQYKGGMELDVVPGPHRNYSTTTTTSLVPNLVDVQPIVVLSNVAKTVGSLYVGAFSAQGTLSMYDFTGGVYLDNLGRVYYPNAGDTIVIKSVYANKGFTSFSGTAFDFNYNIGSGTNPIPAGTTLEFRMVNWGDSNTGAWTAFVDNSSLETVRAALTGFSSSVGLDIQFRVTGATAVAGRYLMSLKFPVSIDATYNPPVYYTQIGVVNAQTGTLLAGFDNTNPTTPVIQSNKTLTGTSGTVPMPYNYDATPVAYRLVARKPGFTWADLSGTYTSATVSIPVTMVALSWYVSGVTGVAFNHTAKTITVSSNLTPIQIASAYQNNLSLLANASVSEFLTCDGVTFAAPTYTVVFSGSGAISGPYTDLAGLHVFISLTGLQTGSTVQVYNVTDSVEITKQVASGTSLVLPVLYTADKTLRIRVTKLGFLPLQTTSVLGQSGVNTPISQEVDLVYTGNAIDGSTVTGVVDDDTNIQIDVSTSLTVQSIYAWFCYYMTQLDGISGPLYGALTAIDSLNYLVKASIAPVQLDNVTTSPVLITGGQITRDDGVNIIAPTSASIQIAPGKSYVAAVDVANIASAVRDVNVSGATLGNLVKETALRVVTS